MAVVRAEVSAEGTSTGWVLLAGASKAAAVQVQDGATTRIGASGSTNQTFTLAMPPGIGEVTSVSTVGDGTTPGASFPEGIQYSVKLAGNFTYTGIKGPDGTYVQYIDALARPGGGSWTPADLYNVEVGCFPSNITLGTQQVTYLGLDVDVTFYSGGFLAMMMQYFGPLVAVGLREIPQLMIELARRSHGRIRLQPGEARAVFEALRAPQPRRVFLGRLVGAVGTL